MPTDSLANIQVYTDKIFAALNQDDPQQLLAVLLDFGEFLGKHFPDKKNEEIYKMLSQSGMDLPSYSLEDNAIINLGAMAGIATRYYSDNEDKSNRLLSTGDDSLYRTYQAWKNAAVIFSHFAKKGQQADLFVGLQELTEKQIDRWSSTVLGKVNEIATERSENKLVQQPVQMLVQEDKGHEHAHAQQLARLQSVCQKYRELLIIELKKVVLALPSEERAKLKDSKGDISIGKILEMPDEEQIKYPDLANFIKKYGIIMELQGTLRNDDYSAMQKLSSVHAIINNPEVRESLTSNPAEKKLWDTIVDIFRTFKIAGTAGFFHAKNKKQTEQELTDVLEIKKPSI